ncbi:hypothetical protein AUEXF2481DRAFT_693609 [Aureobasidium subglaciale EXF-2481]|uniref:Uncharacterized protein n=1 Tax=Aureobasidium subglaciale (strain EXF-2481) TaxID=1043005 RepID=A0A074YDF9_AURSE|nr:uncharacterized protein AUEXF2481DRAFT_693609 [Aureobasidium subglaciale EXF-2481]KEQ95853.1 hypothetical protein AUEXF2481DRAFT_693609 [Aureobasidium subglaciale EXF-2481]
MTRSPGTVKTYLRWVGYSDEIEGQRHFIHAEPFQQSELQPKRLYVFIDIDYKSFVNLNISLAQHEIYAIKRNDDGQLSLQEIMTSGFSVRTFTAGSAEANGCMSSQTLIMLCLLEQPLRSDSNRTYGHTTWQNSAKGYIPGYTVQRVPSRSSLHLAQYFGSY